MATKCVLNKSTMTSIADAIRAKGGASSSLLPSAMPAAIQAIPSGGEPVIAPLTVTANGTYNAPSGTDGYSPVTVNVPGADSFINDWFGGVFSGTINFTGTTLYAGIILGFAVSGKSVTISANNATSIVGTMINSDVPSSLVSLSLDSIQVWNHLIGLVYSSGYNTVLEFLSLRGCQSITCDGYNKAGHINNFAKLSTIHLESLRSVTGSPWRGANDFRNVRPDIYLGVTYDYLVNSMPDILTGANLNYVHKITFHCTDGNCVWDSGSGAWVLQ